MRPAEITTNHPIMRCPVCGEEICALVAVQPQMGEPTVSGEYAVSVPVTATMTRFHLRHNCGGRVEAAESAEETA